MKSIIIVHGTLQELPRDQHNNIRVYQRHVLLDFFVYYPLVIIHTMVRKEKKQKNNTWCQIRYSVFASQNSNALSSLVENTKTPWFLLQ